MAADEMECALSLLGKRMTLSAKFVVRRTGAGRTEPIAVAEPSLRPEGDCVWLSSDPIFTDVTDSASRRDGAISRVKCCGSVTYPTNSATPDRMEALADLINQGSGENRRLS